MLHLISEFNKGWKEGWALFWSPFTAVFAIKKISSEDWSISRQFSLGISDGWSTFWSPFSAFGKAIRKIFTLH